MHALDFDTESSFEIIRDVLRSFRVIFEIMHFNWFVIVKSSSIISSRFVSLDLIPITYWLSIRV